jgi:hypothetical protein
VVEDDQLHLVLLNRRSFFALCMGHDQAAAPAAPAAAIRGNNVEGDAPEAKAAFSHSFELMMTPAAELYIARQELR